MRTTTAAFALCLLVCGPARAADSWTEPFPGIRYLHRSTDEPKEIHVLVVDLDAPGIAVRATRPSEKAQTPSGFAKQVGAAAAINADFFDGTLSPIGYAKGDGEHWPGTADSEIHQYIACFADNRCEIDTTDQARPADPAWHNVVGGRKVLVAGGQIVQTAAKDQACGSFCTTGHPRTAVGVARGGRELMMVMIEGRRSPVYGLSLSRLAALMHDLGAEDALNLDGGGSSGMVVGGKLVNQRPTAEPSERTVANHLAIIHDPSLTLEAAAGAGGLARVDGTDATQAVLCPGQGFTLSLTLANAGSLPWSDDGQAGAGHAVRLAHASGEALGLASPIRLTDTTTPVVAPGAEARFALAATAPQTAGTHASAWQLKDGERPIGPELPLAIQVSAEACGATPADSGAATVDAGVVPGDAGPTGDAGPLASDGGVTFPRELRGSGCALGGEGVPGSGGLLLVLALVAVAIATRRRISGGAAVEGRSSAARSADRPAVAHPPRHRRRNRGR